MGDDRDTREVFEAKPTLQRAMQYASKDLAAAREAFPPDEEALVPVGGGYAFQPTYSTTQFCALATDVERRVRARGEELQWLRSDYR